MVTKIIKNNESGLYYKVDFILNSIRKVSLVEKEKATMFQEEAGKIPMPNGELCIGKMRMNEFSLHAHLTKLKYSDVTIEEFEHPEIEINLQDII